MHRHLEILVVIAGENKAENLLYLQFLILLLLERPWYAAQRFACPDLEY